MCVREIIHTVYVLCEYGLLVFIYDLMTNALIRIGSFKNILLGQ